MYVNINDITQIIQENQSFTDRTNDEATQYPKDWDKSTIPELALVTECACPTDCVMISYHIELIGEVYTQVWDTREYTAGEIAQQTADKISNIKGIQDSLFFKFKWRQERWRDEVEDIAEDDTLTYSDGIGFNVQYRLWARAVRAVNETGTYEEQIIALESLDESFPNVI